MDHAPALAPASPTTAAVAAVHARRNRVRAARLLALYGVALALIAFWPEPVDRGASGVLRGITRAVPWLTYDVIETTSNVLLFVPLGVLLAFVIPRQRGLIVPLALATTLVIETGQALFLAARTPSLRDVIANVLGATIGLALVWLRERRQARSVSAAQGRPMP